VQIIESIGDYPATVDEARNILRIKN
jgi:hypothetical protein